MSKTANPSQDQINNLIHLYQSGKITETEKICRKIIKTHPQSLIIINILGAALQGQGKLQEAVQSYDQAITIKPDYADAYNNRGVALQELGRLEEALKSCNQAIKIKPDYAEAYYNLGNILKELGRLDETVKSYDKAIQIRSDYAVAYNNRGAALQELGQLGEAVQNYRKAISILPDHDLFWSALANCLRSVEFTSCNEDLAHDLFLMLEKPNIDPQLISKAVVSALRNYPKIFNILKVFKSNNINENIDNLTEQLSTIPLLLRMMELSPIPDLDLEKMFCKIRSAMLTRIIKRSEEAKGLSFYAALAMHCFVNEYIFPESEQEKKAINLLQEKIKISLEKNEKILSTQIAVLGAFRPLSDFPWADDLLRLKWSNDINKIFVFQIEDFRKEQTLRSNIPHLTKIENKVSQEVRSQYEENPYPRWINTGLNDKPKSVIDVLQAIDVHRNLEVKEFSDKPDILVAGCGTGQHALDTASKFLNCKVLAVDLSLNSLAYAMRKTQELGITNIKYMQGDILKLNHLEREFDIIESTGVLHHMDDPLVGWKVLVDSLRSGGLMKIGLYSNKAREHIVKARKFISKKKYKPSKDSIRKFREEIIKIDSKSNSEITKVLRSLDFYSLSTCRDFLFHVQEHCFSLPQIETSLNDLGLIFLGFELRQSWIRRNFSEIYSEKDSLTSLSLWHKFELENPSTFRGMYQFWAQKK